MAALHVQLHLIPKQVSASCLEKLQLKLKGISNGLAFPSQKETRIKFIYLYMSDPILLINLTPKKRTHICWLEHLLKGDSRDPQ